MRQQKRKNPRHDDRLSHVKFRLHEEMHRRQDRYRVNEPVQTRPSRGTQSRDHAIGRSRAEGAQAAEGNKADGKVDPREDFGRDMRQIEMLI